MVKTAMHVGCTTESLQANPTTTRKTQMTTGNVHAENLAKDQPRMDVVEEPLRWPLCPYSGGGGGVGFDNRLKGRRRVIAAAAEDEALRLLFLGGSGKCAYCVGGPVYIISGSSTSFSS